MHHRFGRRLGAFLSRLSALRVLILVELLEAEELLPAAGVHLDPPAALGAVLRRLEARRGGRFRRFRRRLRGGELEGDDLPVGEELVGGEHGDGIFEAELEVAGGGRLGALRRIRRGARRRGDRLGRGGGVAVGEVAAQGGAGAEPPVRRRREGVRRNAGGVDAG